MKFQFDATRAFSGQMQQQQQPDLPQDQSAEQLQPPKDQLDMQPQQENQGQELLEPGQQHQLLNAQAEFPNDGQGNAIAHFVFSLNT